MLESFEFRRFDHFDQNRKGRPIKSMKRINNFKNVNNKMLKTNKMINLSKYKFVNVQS